jgi:lipopolysaccharide transport system ATP-binding protein
MSSVLKVENVSKQYRLGQVGTGSLAHDINKWWHSVRGKENPYLKIGTENDRTSKASTDYVWALKDINFEVRQGEVLGIIGKNGAGKSTLLKILSRTTMPTTGIVKVKGRIASLLEVGTGFHPELTGRENVFLNGAILGMTKAEIKNKFDEIVDFAGVERYIDTPVKRYSSGMYVRLAFAVAANLESEILIVDEVLAVGDSEFQKKCLGKMKDVSGREGRTVLFVSHDITSILNLTERCLQLKNGMTANMGDTSSVVEGYIKGDLLSEIEYTSLASPVNPKITNIKIFTTFSNNIHQFGKSLKIEFKLNLPYKLEVPVFSFQIFNSRIQPVLNFAFTSDKFKDIEGVHVITCEIPDLKLYKGRYMLSAYLGEQRSRQHFESVEFVCPFEIQMLAAETNIYLDDVCVYIEESNWEIKGL